MAESLAVKSEITGLFNLALDLAEISNGYIGQARSANGMIPDCLFEIVNLGKRGGFPNPESGFPDSSSIGDSQGWVWPPV